MKNKLSIILGLIGIIFAGYWISINFHFFFGTELQFLPYPKIVFPSLLLLFILYILPILLGLIGAIKARKKPMTSGILMIIGGSIFFYDFLTFFVPYADTITNYVFLIPALFLIIGGLMMSIGNKNK